jgi:protein required for attachment to host cells
MTKPLKTHFVLADGAHARWVERSHDADDFVTIRELKGEAHYRGAPTGVSFDSHSGRPSNIEPRTSQASHERDRFAAEVAEAINAQAVDATYDRLSIVAPARVLAAIKKHLTGAASRKLGKTIAKDLTKVPDHQLKAWLRPLELA